MTAQTVPSEPSPVKRPRILLRAAEVRRRLGEISGPALWRMEQQEPLLAAARSYLGPFKVFDEELFEVFLDDYMARDHTPAAHRPEKALKALEKTRRGRE